MQMSLFDPNPSHDRPTALGQAEVSYVDSDAILTRPTGRLEWVDYALNPYQGCSFACTYCYAAFFPAEEEQRQNWGKWVRVKSNAIDKIRNVRADLRGKRVLMSSATDPYQPLEAKLELTRSLLPLLAQRGVYLNVLSRSPLVTRDIDLFQQFDRISVTLSITTDSDSVRKRFEPHCASIERRLEALSELSAAGLPTSVNVAPLLPIDDVRGFAKRIVATGVSRVHIGTFHESRGPFAAGTRSLALHQAALIGWTERRRKQTQAALRAAIHHEQRHADPRSEHQEAA